MSGTGTEVLMAGFGGQGMLLAGKVLAQAAMSRGLEVSWLPSYGPEMRGGTANVIVCISDRPIASPLIQSPRALLVMNRPSLEKFAPRVPAGGLIVVNSSLVDVDPGRDDCLVVSVAAREVATDAGTDRAANFVMLGAYVGASSVLPPDCVEEALAKEFTGRKEKFVPMNIAAFRAGLEAGRVGEGATP
ncbi:MAG: 2-oxoacid:acceptor oxidoreductase family protein [Planctomycetota bacterium]